jgi:hypothetical protein
MPWCRVSRIGHARHLRRAVAVDAEVRDVGEPAITRNPANSHGTRLSRTAAPTEGAVATPTGCRTMQNFAIGDRAARRTRSSGLTAAPQRSQNDRAAPRQDGQARDGR